MDRNTNAHHQRHSGRSSKPTPERKTHVTRGRNDACRPPARIAATERVADDAGAGLCHFGDQPNVVSSTLSCRLVRVSRGLELQQLHVGPNVSGADPACEEVEVEPGPGRVGKHADVGGQQRRVRVLRLRSFEDG
jgi:hypothetical protein